MKRFAGAGRTVAVAVLLALVRVSVAEAGYQADFQSLEKQLSGTDKATAFLAEAPPDLLAAFLIYRKATLTGDNADYQRAEAAIATALRSVGPHPELLLLQASFHYHLHRLSPLRATLQQLEASGLAEDHRYLALEADLAWQEGRYAEARQHIEKAVARGRNWEDLARLAYQLAHLGQEKAARRLYREAQEQLTAKQMRSWAWLELQQGLLDWEAGRAERALHHYQRAEQGYPGYWLIEEHRAEALASLGRRDEAIALYRKVIESRRAPEFLAALANLLATGAASEAAEAQRLEEEATQIFATQRALYPEASLGHELEFLLTQRVDGNGARLLEMARANFALRPSGEARLLLIRTALATGDAALARRELNELQTTPFRSPEIGELRSELRRLEQQTR